MYPLAGRFLEEIGARLAAVIAMFSPLMITYSNVVKQYSVELLAAAALLLLFGRAFRRDGSKGAAGALAAGAVASWISLSSVFLLAAACLVLAARSVLKQAGAARLALLSRARRVSRVRSRRGGSSPAIR